MTSDPKFVLDPYHMNLNRYVKRMLHYLSNFAEQHGTPIGDMTDLERIEVINAAAEQIRREFKLSRSDHEQYLQIMLIQVLGSNKGRKGTSR